MIDMQCLKPGQSYVLPLSQASRSIACRYPGEMSEPGDALLAKNAQRLIVWDRFQRSNQGLGIQPEVWARLELGDLANLTHVYIDPAEARAWNNILTLRSHSFDKDAISRLAPRTPGSTGASGEYMEQDQPEKGVEPSKASRFGFLHTKKVIVGFVALGFLFVAGVVLIGKSFTSP